MYITGNWLQQLSFIVISILTHYYKISQNNDTWKKIPMWALQFYLCVCVGVCVKGGGGKHLNKLLLPILAIGIPHCRILTVVSIALWTSGNCETAATV